ncbi:MAG TPA: response regulator, partial [Candidatus Caenarcaniphilales bacterium]
IMGNEVRVAYNGEQAIAATEVFRPHVLILDIGMPNLSGYDTARRILEQPWSKDITLVALTGWGQDEDKRRSQEAGFDHHLVKPVNLTALERLLVTVGNSAQKTSEDGLTWH